MRVCLLSGFSFSNEMAAVIWRMLNDLVYYIFDNDSYFRLFDDAKGN